MMPIMSTAINSKNVTRLERAMMVCMLVFIGLQLWVKDVALSMHPRGNLTSETPAFNLIVHSHTELWRISIALALITLSLSVVIFATTSFKKWIKLLNVILAIGIGLYSFAFL